jgi:cytoskeletal protein RodZ
MISDAKTLGELYKSKREELNLSVREVESATSIRAPYIESIENGSGKEMLSSVYMQGFMRQYAVFLGLDPEMIEGEYKEAFSKEPKMEEETRDFSYGLGSIEVRPGSLSNSIWKSGNLIWGVAFVGVFTIAYLLIKLLGIF